MTALREFVTDLLESEGAVIDAVEPDGLDVMAPEHLRSAYGWPELARLGFGAAAPAGSIPIGLEDDWLDRLGALLGERGRLAERQISMPEAAAPPNDPQRLINHALSLPNAVWRLIGVEPGWTRCLLLAFRYTAVSDEKREGLVWLGFNCGTGAVLDDELVVALRRSLDSMTANRSGASSEVGGRASPDPQVSQTAGPIWDAARVTARTGPLLDRMVRADLEPFLAAMRRRLNRDRRRVHAYHDDLRRAALDKLAGLDRPKGVKTSEKTTARRSEKLVAEKLGAEKLEAEKIAAAVARERMRVSAIEREYAAKLDDLRHNYALSVRVEWVQALVLVAPVQRHTLLIKRRKGERTIAMDWHVAARRMESADCDWGNGLAVERLVCDDQLHLTEPSGQSNCACCGKPFCRACHPASCPRCTKPPAAHRS